jgi:glyoxylase-like metal-dependent hydrolase (beta-lactamase superfamily II)
MPCAPERRDPGHPPRNHRHKMNNYSVIKNNFILRPLSPHVYQLSLGFVNAFLLHDTANGDLTLVDTGIPGSTPKIITALQKSGLDPAAIRRIILTHAHTDHAGSVAQLKNLLRIPVWAHADAANLVEAGLSGQLPLLVSPGFVNKIVYQLFIKRAAQHIEATTIDRRLQDAEILPIAGGIRIIHTPGHATGHLSLLLEQDSLLLAADACANAGGLNYSTVYENRDTGLQSLLKIAAFDFDKAAFGHGGPIKTGAAAAIRAKFSAAH